MKPLSLLALAAVGGALAQQPAPTPLPCLATAGLEVGMTRQAAFDMMRKKLPDLKTTDAKSFHFAPAGRPYKADLTFSSGTADATVTQIRFEYAAATVLTELRDRFGAPEKKPDGTQVWRVPRCHATLTYRELLDAGKSLVGEEVTVTPLGK